MNNIGKLVLTALLLTLPLGCGGEESEGDTSVDATDADDGPGQFGNSGDATVEIPVTGTPIVDFGISIEEKNSELTEDLYKIYFNQFIPEGCSNDTPCPLIVLVPDQLASGDAFFGEVTPRWIAAKTKAIVATYNPPSRGKEGRASTGTEDYNGTTGQDALSDVLNYMIKSPRTTDQVGIISFGYGLVAASGAFARFKASKLKEVDFLIDVEGPVNRCWTTAIPGDFDAGVQADGVGVNESRCDFDLGPRLEAFPVTLPNDAPAPVICHESAFPLNGAGETCENDQWWLEREAKNFLDDIAGNYLRLQMLYDHRQASRWSSLEAIKYVVKSDVENHILNSQAPNQPLHTVGDATCVENGCYLDFTAQGLGNSIAFPVCFEEECVEKPNPYAAAFPDYEPFSMDSFAQNILPLYVELLFSL